MKKMLYNSILVVSLCTQSFGGQLVVFDWPAGWQEMRHADNFVWKMEEITNSSFQPAFNDKLEMGRNVFGDATILHSVERFSALRGGVNSERTVKITWLVKIDHGSHSDADWYASDLRSHSVSEGGGSDSYFDVAVYPDEPNIGDGVNDSEGTSYMVSSGKRAGPFFWQHGWQNHDSVRMVPVLDIISDQLEGRSWHFRAPVTVVRQLVTCTLWEMEAVVTMPRIRIVNNWVSDFYDGGIKPGPTVINSLQVVLRSNQVVYQELPPWVKPVLEVVKRVKTVDLVALNPDGSSKCLVWSVGPDSTSSKVSLDVANPLAEWYFLAAGFLPARIARNPFGQLDVDLVFGDLNDDDEIDVTDIDKVLGVYLMDSSSTRWLEIDQDGFAPYIADFDGNGEIDLADIDEVVGNYGNSFP